jgi:hypothetical protein
MSVPESVPGLLPTTKLPGRKVVLGHPMSDSVIWSQSRIVRRMNDITGFMTPDRAAIHSGRNPGCALDVSRNLVDCVK